MECPNNGYKYSICTLTIMYKLFMHSLSLFKIVAPKAINKILHQYDFSTPIPSPPLSYITAIKDKIEHTNVPSIPIELLDHPINIPFQQEQQQREEEVDLTKTINVDYLTSNLRRNLIDGRVKSLQYQANNPCEDTLTYSQLKSINAYTVSVFDGHGGPQLAQYSKAKISSFIDSFLSKHSKKLADIGQLIKESLRWSYERIEETFFQIYQQQIKIGNKKMKYVGTCGITAIVYNDRVYIGNAGDSQAIFILGEGEGLMRSQRANNRLSVNNKAERERIMKEWAGVDDQIITQESSNTYYLKGRLQPTRTIGDYYLKKKEYYPGDDYKGPYLSCTPEIQQHKITKSHKYLIVASDGIWDSLNKNQVMNILMEEKEIDLNKTCYDTEEEQAPHIKNIVPNILQKASELSGKSIDELKKMEKGTRRNYHDDITMAVISLQNQS